MACGSTPIARSIADTDVQRVKTNRQIHWNRDVRRNRITRCTEGYIRRIADARVGIEVIFGFINGCLRH